MRRLTRLLIAIAAVSAVGLPVAHAQFGFGGTSGSPGGGFNSGSGFNSGGLPGLSNGVPGLGSNAGQSGGTGASNDTATAGQPGNDSSDRGDETPAPAPTTTPAPNSDWTCPAGYTPWLDEDG